MPVGYQPLPSSCLCSKTKALITCAATVRSASFLHMEKASFLMMWLNLGEYFGIISLFILIFIIMSPPCKGREAYCFPLASVRHEIVSAV